MSRRAARVDDNQSAIVKELRQMGFSVAVTSGAGDGFPDLVIGRGGVNYMFEIKDPKKSPSRRALTTEQVKFHRDWRGQIAVIERAEDVLMIVANVLAKQPAIGGSD